MVEVTMPTKDTKPGVDHEAAVKLAMKLLGQAHEDRTLEGAAATRAYAFRNLAAAYLDARAIFDVNARLHGEATTFESVVPR